MYVLNLVKTAISHSLDEQRFLCVNQHIPGSEGEETAVHRAALSPLFPAEGRKDAPPFFNKVDSPLILTAS